MERPLQQKPQPQKTKAQQGQPAKKIGLQRFPIAQYVVETALGGVAARRLAGIGAPKNGIAWFLIQQINL